MKQGLKKVVYRSRHCLNKFRRHLNATQLVILSFLAVIISGSLILSLPISHKAGAEPAAYIDCLFTAVSATCVTGLVTVTTASQWNLFGQLVILAMIQIGGLSFVTLFTFFVANIGKKINIKNRMVIQVALNQNNLQGMVRIVTFAIKFTLLFEGIGALLLFLFFWLGQKIPTATAFYWGLFHSVSSFCNAGFDVIGDSSLSAYAASPLLNTTVMVLIITGGMGFTVWQNIKKMTVYYINNKQGKRVRLSLHTKLALITTGVLILSGALYFFATEYKNPSTLKQLSLAGKIWSSFFQSVTLRTAGFYTIDQFGLTESSKFVSSILMLIGGSPGGTAGGIKTVTLAVLLSSVAATLRGSENIDVLHRRISWAALQKAITIVGVMFSMWFAVATILEFTENGSAFSYTFMDLLFEVASALGTVGITTGITPYLTLAGKILIMTCMFIGRLGPVSIAVALHRRMTISENNILLPEEDILIG